MVQNKTIALNDPAVGGCVEKHQLAGLDDRERGFNRIVEVARIGPAYRAVLMYETSQIITEGQETETAALQELIRQLHARGYTQLRSQLSFRGSSYFGSTEPWIEYSDPARPERRRGFWSRLVGWFRHG